MVDFISFQFWQLPQLSHQQKQDLHCNKKLLFSQLLPPLDFHFTLNNFGSITLEPLGPAVPGIVSIDIKYKLWIISDITRSCWRNCFISHSLLNLKQTILSDFWQDFPQFSIKLKVVLLKYFNESVVKCNTCLFQQIFPFRKGHQSKYIDSHKKVVNILESC